MATMLENPAKIDSLIWIMTVEILWERLEEIKQDHVKGTADLLTNWCHVFRALRCRLKFRRNLARVLPLIELVRFDLQMCVFLYALNFSVVPEKLLQHLRDQSVLKVWESILKSSHKEGAQYNGLHDILPLLSALWMVATVEVGNVQKNTSKSRCGSHFVEDVLSYFLQDKGPFMDFTGTEFNIFIESAKYFVSRKLIPISKFPFPSFPFSKPNFVLTPEVFCLC
jgi:hypothetical protein